MKFSSMMLVGREIKHTPWRWRGIIKALVQKYRKRGTVPPAEWDETFFRYAHQFCNETNRSIKHKAKICGCFYCGAVFEPQDIKVRPDLNSSIVFCPHCHIDSVIYDGPGVPITEEFMKAMKEYYF